VEWCEANYMQVILETERLFLRKMTMEDLEGGEADG
jgi:hypothetical protein